MLFVTDKNRYTNEEVEDADAEHIERDTNVAVVVEPVMHMYTQTSHTHTHTHTNILFVFNERFVCFGIFALVLFISFIEIPYYMAAKGKASIFYRCNLFF